MKYLCLLAIALVLISGCNHVKYSGGLHDIGTALRSKLSNGWRCETVEASIVIRYESLIDKLNTISLPDSPSEDLLKEFGWKDNCFVKLKFVKKLTDTQYSTLVRNRQTLLSKLRENKSIDGKTKFRMEEAIIYENPIPTYFNTEYSIYLELSEAPYVMLFPKQREKEHDAILHQIENLFSKYNTDSL